MRVLLLHGSGEVGSRKKLVEIKEKFDPNAVVTFENGAEIKDILASVQTASFLSENRLIILENPPENTLKDLSRIPYPLSLTLIFWFDHELKKLPDKKTGLEILFFPELKEISVFPFLDCLADGKKEAFLEAKKLETAGFEFHYLITMVFYLLRTLIVVPKNAPSFVQKKLSRQKQKFSVSKVTEIYRYLLELNFKVNSGAVEPSQAQFLMINKFLS